MGTNVPSFYKGYNKKIIAFIEGYEENKMNNKKKKNNDNKKTRLKKTTKEMPEIQSSDANGNRNEAVLKLHAEGKSNVAIAKELGLGVGEVKLIIDLYRQS